MHDFEQRALDHHVRLPGILRALLHDRGISSRVIEKRLLGWDGTHVTIPVRDQAGQVVFFERWDPKEVGVPVDSRKTVELFGWDVLDECPARLVIAEGCHEALVFESVGVPAVSATYTGRFFKERLWSPALASTADIVLAFRRGDKRERGKYLPSRAEVVEAITSALPDAHVLDWPPAIGDQGGAFDYFVTLMKTADDFWLLVDEAR